MKQKYRIIKDIPNWFNEGVALQNITWYKSGDEIEYNEWTGGYHKHLDCYKYRMITKEFIENNKQYFEEIK